jgi:hypothetical protein
MGAVKFSFENFNNHFMSTEYENTKRHLAVFWPDKFSGRRPGVNQLYSDIGVTGGNKYPALVASLAVHKVGASDSSARF